MVMAGKDGLIKVDSTLIGYIDSWNVTFNRGTAETSQIGKDYKEFIPTAKDASGSASGSFDYADASQKSIVDQFKANGVASAVDLKLLANSTLELKVSALITSIAFGDAHGDKITFSFNFQATGDFTMGAPAA